MTRLAVPAFAVLLEKPEKRAFALLALALCGILATSGFQALTGDEPRYFLYSYAFFANGSFEMSPSEWPAVYFRATGADGVAYPGVGATNHAIYIPVLLSPIAYVFSLAGLRTTSLLVGLAGLWCLLQVCLQATGKAVWPAMAAIALATLSLPLLPYLHLFYMEAFLFAAFSAGWYRVHAAPASRGNDLVTGALILSLPFIHLRGSVVGAVLFVIFLWQVYRHRARTDALPRIALLAGVAAAALLVLVGCNVLVYGSVLGSVSTARPPEMSFLFSMVALQWFNIHHGLMAYAPVWLLGYAGLVAGALAGAPLPREGLVLAAVVILTSIGINPGECWPARFWVLSIPMLAVGLAWWLHVARSPLLRAVTLGLIILTLTNSLIFIGEPNLFLENRQTPVTYQRLFDYLPLLHFGLVLPHEIEVEPHLGWARFLLLTAVVFMAALVASQFRPVMGWVALAILLIAVDSARVRVIPSSGYQISSTADGLRVDMLRALGPVAYVQYGHKYQSWFDGATLTPVSIAVTGRNGGSDRWQAPAYQIISARCRGGVVAIEFRGPPELDVKAKVAAGVRVYQSRSFIHGLVSRFRSRCSW